jgi:hypothetical protein
MIDLPQHNQAIIAADVFTFEVPSNFLPLEPGNSKPG